MVGVSVEELSGLGLGAPVLMSPPPACCGCWTDHWPALKEQKATTTKVSARSRYFAGGAFLPGLGLGGLSSSRGPSDVDSRSYCGSGMAERGQAVGTVISLKAQEHFCLGFSPGGYLQRADRLRSG
jgi:hypothetical protein